MQTSYKADLEKLTGHSYADLTDAIMNNRLIHNPSDTLVNANKTLTANYEQQQVSMVTLSHDPSTGNFKATLSGAGTYAVGAKIRVRANNVSDWTLVNWTRKDNGEVMSTTNEFDYVTTEEDVEFVAHYRFTPGSSPAEPNETKAKHKVTLKANPSKGGSVSNSTPFWVREGEQYWIKRNCTIPITCKYTHM